MKGGAAAVGALTIGSVTGSLPALATNGWTFCPVDIMNADGDVNLPIPDGKAITNHFGQRITYISRSGLRQLEYMKIMGMGSEKYDLATL